MLKPKFRVGLLGLLVVLLVGSYASAMAEAQGPFYYHRPLGGKGNGVKISAQEPEGVAGGGGKAVLESRISLTEIEIVASQVQVKGILYNNALQGQAKLELAYVQPELVKPSLKGCVVTIGINNTLKVYGHQSWKWNGSKQQLEEQPQSAQTTAWILLPQELQQGAEALPSATFTTVKFVGAGCGVLAGTFQIKGSIAATPEFAGLEIFGTAETTNVLTNGQKQHFWNGTKNIGVEVGLKLAEEPAKLKQQTVVGTTGRQGGAQQEIARLES